MDRYRFSLIAVFSALTAAGALIKIPLMPVPITLQNLFVVMAGMLLGPRAGVMSQVIYILIGLMGLPVFSGGGGPGYVLRPTFGYLLGFVAAAAVSGYVMQGRRFTVSTVLVASCLSMLTVYLIGVPYLAGYFMLVLKKPDAVWLAVKTGMVVFLPGDALKCVLLAMVMPKLQIFRKPPAGRGRS